MIRSCRDAATRKLVERQFCREFQAIERAARIKIELLDAATALSDLRLPGLRLEALKGSRKGQYSIRINDQYRLCFEWRQGDAHNVEVVDYH